MSYSYKSNDGLCSSSDPSFVELWNSIVKKQKDDQVTWVQALRSQGVKAAHPDDGWVDRDKNEVQLCYPQFDDGIQVGDIIALGWEDSFRLVTVTGKKFGGLSRLATYSFTE